MQSDRNSGRRPGTGTGERNSRPQSRSNGTQSNRDDRSAIQKEIANAVSAVAGKGGAPARGRQQGASRRAARPEQDLSTMDERAYKKASSSYDSSDSVIDDAAAWEAAERAARGAIQPHQRGSQRPSTRSAPGGRGQYSRGQGSRDTNFRERPSGEQSSARSSRVEPSRVEPSRAERSPRERISSDRPDRERSDRERPSRSADTRGRGSRGRIVVDRPLASNGRGGRVKQYIDPNKFIRGAVAVEQEEYIPQNRFEDFQVHKKIIANLLAKGYETPTPIQDQTIKLVLEGKDVVGIANTGTGKTAAFAVPLIHDLVTNMDNRMLVLAPTRELAQQIVEEMLSFSKGLGFKIALIIGGVSINPQIKTLKQFPRIVVGTPGRIKDHIGQGTIDLSRFNRVVLDEVDRMLDMGFIRDITAILSKVNPKRQSLFFSATMEPEIEALIGRFSHNAERVSTRTSVTADSVDQNVIWYRDKDDKIERLHELLIKGDRGKTIIFDDTKRLVERLGKELAARGFKVDRIHGDKSQAQRSRAIARLKSGEIDILVATDVAARGLDVSDVTHVINFSQPNTYDDYVHRIGRTGRAGKTGQAYTFVQKE